MPTLITPRDVNFFRRRNVEVYKRYFFPVKVYKVRAEEFDTVYGENVNKTFEEPYEMEAYIPNLPGWANSLTRFGLDSDRKLRIYFSRDLLAQQKVSPPDVGDRIQVQGDFYKVYQSNPVDYGSNLQLPLTHVCELERVRPENPAQGTVVAGEY